jgi:translation elongation factor EF-Ts
LCSKVHNTGVDMACIRLALFVASLTVTALAARAGEVSVAVAANFAGPLARLSAGFTAATGHVLKVSSGATGKFYAQVCMLEQGFVKDPDTSVTKLLDAKGKELGDTLSIRRFIRYQLGE